MAVAAPKPAITVAPLVKMVPEMNVLLATFPNIQPLRVIPIVPVQIPPEYPDVRFIPNRCYFPPRTVVEKEYDFKLVIENVRDVAGNIAIGVRIPELGPDYGLAWQGRIEPRQVLELTGKFKPTKEIFPQTTTITVEFAVGPVVREIPEGKEIYVSDKISFTCFVEVPKVPWIPILIAVGVAALVGIVVVAARR